MLISYLTALCGTEPMTEPTPNDLTIDAYNAEWTRYILNTPGDYLPSHEPLLRWINFSLGQLPQGASILEIGSGHGREAAYMETHGFRVTRSDGAQAWVDFLANQGHDALLINAVRDDFGHTVRQHQMVFANAVMPHFTPGELATVLTKIGASLPAGGLLAFSVKQGQGERWVNEKLGTQRRYIYHWDKDDLKGLVEASGYKIVFIETDIPGDLPTHTWINLTAQVEK